MTLPQPVKWTEVEKGDLRRFACRWLLAGHNSKFKQREGFVIAVCVVCGHVKETLIPDAD